MFGRGKSARNRPDPPPRRIAAKPLGDRAGVLMLAATDEQRHASRMKLCRARPSAPCLQCLHPGRLRLDRQRAEIRIEWRLARRCRPERTGWQAESRIRVSLFRCFPSCPEPGRCPHLAERADWPASHSARDNHQKTECRPNRISRIRPRRLLANG